MGKSTSTPSSNSTEPRVLHRLTVVASVCLFAVFVFSISMLCAWLIPAVGAHFREGWKATKFNIVLCDLLGALSLTLQGPKFSRREQRIGWFCALLIALIASAVLYQYISGVNVGINTFIVSDALSGHPGRMSPQSAITFLLLAVVLLMVRARKSLLSYIADGLTLCLGLAMLTFAFGYLYVVFHLFALTTENRMGPLTVCGIFLLTVAIFIYRMPNGIFSVLVSDSIAGNTSRIAAPLTIGLPFLLAVLGVAAGKTSLMRNEYSNALATATVALLTFCLLLVMAHRILGLERNIRDLSLRDELTQLYNRRGFYVLASQALLLAQRTRSPLSMLYVDMDDLKQVNDTLGHEVGSELLHEMAQILSLHFRQTDVVGRIGGDEFVVVANASHLEMAAITHRLQGAIALVNDRPNRLYTLGFSFGIVTTDTHAETLDDLLRKADQVMYQAKRGKGRRSSLSPSL